MQGKQCHSDNFFILFKSHSCVQICISEVIFANYIETMSWTYILSDHSFTGSNNICTIIVRFGKSVPIQGAAEIWLPPNILGQY